VPNYHAMKVYRGNGGNAPHLLNIGTRFKWVISFMLWAKSPQYQFDRVGPYRETNPGCPACMSKYSTGTKQVLPYLHMTSVPCLCTVR
jgi:hypothetical protein